MKETKKDRTPKLKKIQDTEPFMAGEKPEKRPLPGFVKKLILIVIAIAALAALYAAAAGIGYVVMTGSRPIADEALVSRMEELIPAAEEVNEIVWGKGLALHPEAAPLVETVTGAQYRPVSPDLPYKSTSDLREAIGAVYSSAYVKSAINYAMFDGAEGAKEGYELSPRYADKKELQEDGSTLPVLTIDITNPGFELGAKLDPKSVSFVRRVVSWNGLWWESDLITVSITEEYKGTTSTRELNLRLEDGVWLLDDPTY